MKNILIKNYNETKNSNKFPHYYENIYGWFNNDAKQLYENMVLNAKNNSHFVEIGSFLGKSTSFMGVEIKNSGKKIIFDVIDTFSGSANESYHQDIINVLPVGLYDSFISNMKDSNILDIINVKIGYSTEICNQYSDNSLDFIFIDANHEYDSVKSDILLWYPKLKNNGIIAGDDYNVFNGVTHAVNEIFPTAIINGNTWKYIKNNENININFINTPFVEITGESTDQYKVEFIDKENNTILYETIISINNWAKLYREYYTKYIIKIYKNNILIHTHEFSLENKRVLISFESKSLGDTIAWFPYVEEFRKKHNCIIICSTFWNELFQSEYKNIIFVKPNTIVENLYASYKLGVYPNNNNKNKNDYRTIPLQQIATDILGLEYIEIKPKITKYYNNYTNISKKYVCIAEHSTAQAKYWNNSNGWNTVVNYLKENHYDVLSISKEGSNLNNTIEIKNKPIELIIFYILNCEFFIGLPSGLSWLAWALNKKVIIISGFSKKWYEFKTDYYVSPDENICNGCFVDPNIEFDKGDWYWCPKHKNTDRQFECTKKINPEMVINEIKKIF